MFLQLEYYVKYPSPLNSSMARVFFSKKVESSKLVLEFLGLEYYVKYSSPLNSGMVV